MMEDDALKRFLEQEHNQHLYFLDQQAALGIGEDDQEMQVERENLAHLSKALNYQREDLHCFIPAR